MSKEQDRFTKKAPSQPSIDLLIDLYNNLPAGPLTAQALAKALAPHCPDISVEKLAEDCTVMLQGVENGMADCEHARALKSPQEVNLFILARLREGLMQCPPEERKSRLLLAVQDLRNRSGCPLNAETCGLLATFSEEELLAELAFLSCKCGDIGTHQLLSATDAQNKEVRSAQQPSVIAARASDFTDQEHLWIISAAAYASGDQPDMVASPKEIGEQVGFIGRLLQTIHEFTNSKFGSEYAVPGILATCSTALAVFAAKHGMSWIFAMEGQLASLSFLAADSVIPAIIAEVTLVVGAYLWVCAIGIAAISLLFLVINACNDIQEHLENRKAAAQQAVPAGPVPVEVPPIMVETPYGQEETGEGETEDPS